MVDGAGVAPSPLGSAKVWRLSDPAVFQALNRAHHRSRSGAVSVSWVPAAAAADPARVAYAIGKRVGGAVVRNRLRRRLRAILGDLTPVGGAYLVSVRPEAVGLSAPDLKAQVRLALQGLGPTARPPQ